MDHRDPESPLSDKTGSLDPALAPGAVDPGSSFGRYRDLQLLGYRLRAQYEQDHGLDPSASMKQAFEGLQKGVELSGGDAGAYNDLGNAYLTRAGPVGGSRRGPRARRGVG